MKNTTEIWKDIEGYEGLYQVSNYGRIQSKKYGKEKVLYQYLTTKGYLLTALSKNGKVCRKLTHRLVAEAFIPNPQNKPFIDHINGNKTDNRVENLRWVTAQENTHNPITYKKFFKPLSQEHKQNISNAMKKIWSKK